jgi:tRNA(adenine34) deaminase
MREALRLAAQAGERGEVPVGALIVRDGIVLGQAFNQPISGCDPTAHAEIVALRQAAEAVGNYRLPGATCYVTIEPCHMCAGALVHARIGRLVFGAREPKAGAVVSRNQLLDAPYLNHRVVWEEGVLERQCAAIVSDFFAGKRRQAARSKGD